MTRNYTRSKREKRSFSKLVFILPHFGKIISRITRLDPCLKDQSRRDVNVISSELRKLEGG